VTLLNPFEVIRAVRERFSAAWICAVGARPALFDGARALGASDAVRTADLENALRRAAAAIETRGPAAPALSNRTSG